MGILPLIDLLVLLGSGTLIVGFVLKALDLATRYKPAILGFSSLDFLLMTGVFWVFALVLTARTWVKLNEPKLFQLRRDQLTVGVRQGTQPVGYRVDEEDGEDRGLREPTSGER